MVVLRLLVGSIRLIKVNSVCLSRLYGQSARVNTASLTMVMSCNGWDKLKKVGHAGGRALTVVGRSLDIVKPVPIHGHLVLLVYRSKKSDAVGVWSE